METDRTFSLGEIHYYSNGPNGPVGIEARSDGPGTSTSVRHFLRHDQLDVPPGRRFDDRRPWVMANPVHARVFQGFGEPLKTPPTATGAFAYNP